MVKPFADLIVRHAADGMLKLGFRHRVNDLIVENAGVRGVSGGVLEDSVAGRGCATSSMAVLAFEQSTISRGCGGHDYVDGKMCGIAAKAGAGLINEDWMWDYSEGLQNFASIWPNHGICILLGLSSM